MASAKSIIHRDQVHGDVHYDRMAAALLNSEVLQRLGRVYQLGYSHLVFRGGTHTRLSHVMGAAHVAGEIVDSLRRNYRQGRAARPTHVASVEKFLPNPALKKKSDGSISPQEALEFRWQILRHLVTWAALLHDTGHIPLGHTLEDEFDGIFNKHDDLSSPRSSFLWNEHSEIYRILTDSNLYPEAFSSLEIKPTQVWEAVLLICFFKDIDIEKLDKEIVRKNPDSRPFQLYLQQEEKRASVGDTKAFIRDIQRAYENDATLFRPYMADIVANTICADYLDYVKRDPMNVGLDVLKDDRILSHFYVSHQEQTHDLRMALALLDRHGKPRLDVCTGVVEQVRQRYRFAELIYYHKTKVAASAMFAKAMSFVGKPMEIPVKPTVLSLTKTSLRNLALDLAQHKSSLDEFKDRLLPSALLSPEIGDDSLHLLLMHKSVENIEKVTADKTLDSDIRRTKIENNLKGIALLQAISRRHLYKVSVSLSAEQFAAVTKGALQAGAAEKRLKVLIDKLRETQKNSLETDGTLSRAFIEQKMSSAVNWPDGSILLYVPERKSQAKGIDTFAFDSEGVVRLNEHPAVSEKVNELSRDYRKLWRLIVLTHPDRQDDPVELSLILDVLIRSLWREDLFGPNLNDEHLVHQLRDIARFTYIRGDHREAARILRSYASTARLEIDWPLFERAPIITALDGNSIGSMEYAERAYLLHTVRDRIIRSNLGTAQEADSLAIKAVRKKFALATPSKGLQTHRDDISKIRRKSNQLSGATIKTRVTELDQAAAKLLQIIPQIRLESDLEIEAQLREPV